MSGNRIRRPHSLIAHWEGARFLLHNYLGGRSLQIDPIVMHLLDGFSEYLTREQANERLQGVPKAAELLNTLLANDLLVQEDSELDRRDKDLNDRWRWGQEARFFHFGTRDVPYERDVEVQRSSLLRLMVEEPPAGPFKQVDGPRVRLPARAPVLPGRLGEILLRRRTRRRFASTPLSTSTFAQVLRWTWGSTAICESGEIGPYLLKTSPSGGARHSIEVYPLILNVVGLERGAYHFAVQDGSLSYLGPAPESEELQDVFGGQPWLVDAPVIFVMASRVERSDWKYRHSHAYRVLLLDAGHLGQTFHLVCTALGLAPFTLAGFQDTRLEEIFKLDGIGDLPLYAAACGYPNENSQNLSA